MPRKYLDLVDLRLTFDAARAAWIAETAKYSVTRNTESRLWVVLWSARRAYEARFLQATPDEVRRAMLYFREEGE